METTDVIETPEKYSSPEDFVHYISPYVKNVKAIYDIGALDGRDGKILHGFFPEASLHMFEAMKGNYDSIGCGENEYRHHVVLSNFDGKTTFFQNEINGIHSLYEHDNGLVTPFETETRRLDTFVKDSGLVIPDVVKIDVEGAAYEVLEGFGKLLKDVQAIHIETETYPYFKGQILEDKVWELLEKTHKLIQFNRNTVDHRGTQCDSIWIKK